MTVFNQAKKMLYREFQILSLAALIIIYDNNKYCRSIFKRTGKEDSVIKRGGVVDNRLELI
jgi:hypothetical protein